MHRVSRDLSLLQTAEIPGFIIKIQKLKTGLRSKANWSLQKFVFLNRYPVLATELS